MGAMDITQILKIIAAGTALAVIVIYFKSKLETWASKKLIAKKHIAWQEEQERREAYHSKKSRK